MQSIKQDLEIRCEEVNRVISYLKHMENGNVEYRTTVEGLTTVKTSIKAGIVLMLYNAIESTMTKCLVRLHEILITKNLAFNNCNEKLRHLVAVYYENARDKSANNHSKASHSLKFYDYIVGVNTFDLSYEDISKFYPLYSGNLDSREIIAVLEKYGIEFDERVSELKTIKDYRNKLAHGENSFEEIGRELTIQQIEHLKGQTFVYMEKVITEINKYIVKERYTNNLNAT
ncbi:MAE_28990/MAE_18760 family HEPN-like nuclease [uncultured Oscillibacter sp.]|uniref:MAE_28990/MAE_18760 family HEPN-like nuclease n=1 Tax=uncultured Oscillibacter sp. TaxID=876091 RepID=UPI002600343E|nr:MAE_28990/MAE_18760 family HEPN-like nuclease [uncultured Oscillibacter sp.]